MIIHKWFDKDHQKTNSWGRNRIWKIYLLPGKIIDLIIDFISKSLGIDKPFPDAFIKLYKRIFRLRFKIDADSVGTENYWLPTLNSCSKCPTHASKIHTWLHLYGFNRNTSASFYASAFIINILMFIDPKYNTPFTNVYILVLWILAIFLGIRYWNIYSHYYTKGVIRAFVEVNTSKV
jgi:hypothetical protein